MGTLSKMFLRCSPPLVLLLPLLSLLVATQAAPQMERMGQPIADAYEAVDNVVGKALNVVFQLSSWFADYETAPYTNIGEIQEDGLEERLYPARKWVCTKKTSSVADTDPKSGMFWSLFGYIQGANSLESKIKMTTPVTTQVKKNTEAGTVTHEMCFYIGAEYEDNTPTPGCTSRRSQRRRSTPGSWAAGWMWRIGKQK